VYIILSTVCIKVDSFPIVLDRSRHRYRNGCHACLDIPSPSSTGTYKLGRPLGGSRRRNQQRAGRWVMQTHLCASELNGVLTIRPPRCGDSARSRRQTLYTHATDSSIGPCVGSWLLEAFAEVRHPALCLPAMASYGTCSAWSDARHPRGCMRLGMTGPHLQPALWIPSLWGSADRPRPVLRFELVSARASTDRRGFYYGVEAPSLWLSPPA
jgi:hypothetical protein